MLKHVVFKQQHNQTNKIRVYKLKVIEDMVGTTLSNEIMCCLPLKIIFKIILYCCNITFVSIFYFKQRPPLARR